MPQTVFNTQSSRGVLIVTPVGDAVSFRESDVNHSVNLVLERIGSATPPLVVVDFGNSSYFGSVIIGAVVTFAEQVKQAGGAIAACRVSDEMLGVFKVMHLDQLWTVCETRREAVRAVRRTSSGE